MLLKRLIRNFLLPEHSYKQNFHRIPIYFKNKKIQTKPKSQLKQK